MDVKSKNSERNPAARTADVAARWQSERERQQRSWLFRKFYPNYVSQDMRFNEILASLITRDCLIVDAGCGAGEVTQLSHGMASQVIGIDREEDLTENLQVTLRVQGDLEFIPLASGTVDLIVCKSVVEHLEHPPRVFAEFARILRSGRYVLVHTPNIQHYVQWLVKVIPQRFHSSIVQSLCSRPSFFKFRRANTPNKLVSAIKSAGLEMERLDFFESAPDYLQKWPPLYLGGIIYERLVNSTPRLAHWRLNMFGVFRKP